MIFTDRKFGSKSYFNNILIKIQLRYILPILGFFSINEIQAGHANNVNLTYQYLGDYVYQVELHILRYCGRGFDSYRLDDTSVFISCNNGNVLRYKIELDTLLSRSLDITPSCPNSLLGCGGYGGAFEVYTYSFKLNFNDSLLRQFKNCNNVRVAHSICCRPSNITTGSANSMAYNFFELNMRDAPDNSSPSYFTNFFPNLPCGRPKFLTVGAVDTFDFDSISFHWAPIMSNRTNQVSYNNSNLSYNHPINVFYPGTLGPPLVNVNGFPPNFIPIGIYLNQKNGDLVFTPTQCGQRTAAIIEVKEWRKFPRNTPHGIVYAVRQIASTRREFHLFVDQMPCNNAPRIFCDSTYEVCENERLCFSITTDDTPCKDPITGKDLKQDTVTLDWSKTIRGATFEIKDDSAELQEVEFCWTPSVGQSQDYHHRFIVSARDNHCSWNAISYRTIQIKVHPAVPVQRKIEYLNCGKIVVESTLLDSLQSFRDTRWFFYDTLGNQSSGENIVKILGHRFTRSNVRYDTIQFIKSGTFILGQSTNSCQVNMDTVHIPDFLTVSLEDFEICQGRDLFYPSQVNHAMGSFEYDWKFLDQSSQLPLIVIAKVDQSFEAYLTVRDSVGCVVSDNGFITVLPWPEFSLPKDTILCIEGEIEVQSPITAQKYLWSNGDTTQSTFIGGGTHFLNVTDSAGCQFTDSISLLEQTAVIPQYSWNQVLCQGDSLRLEVADFPATVSNFLISYAGQTYNSRSITLPPSLDSNEILRFTFTVNEHDIQCVQHWDDTLNVLPKASLSVELPDTLCSADLPFIPNVNHSGIDFQSSWDGSGIAPTYNTTVNQGYYGPFEMSAFAISAEGCTTHFSQPLTVAHLDEVQITAPSDYCIVLPSTLELPSTSAMGNDIQWSSNGSGTFTNNVYRFATQDTAQSRLVFYAQTTHFTPCPLAIDSAEMAVYPQPKAIFTANPQSGCNPLEVNVSAQNQGYQNYDWLLYGVRENSGQTATLTFDRSGVYPLQLAIRHFNCVDTSNAVEINVYPVPQVEISFNPEEIYGGNTPVEFFVRNYDASATYTWFVNDVEVSKERRFTTSLGDTGFHQVRVEIRSKDGCLNEAVLEIFVHREAFIIFPNAFYPGTQNFNKNEAFRPVTYGIADWEIEVFAPRMGQKLYEGKNQAWDGGSHPQGTYMFIARYTTLSGEKGEMSGTVHLLR